MKRRVKLFVAENYDKSIEELTWHLIKEQLVKANDIKVEQDDILNMAKETTRAQFAQYGMLSVPEEILDNYSWANGIVLSGQKIIDAAR